MAIVSSAANISLVGNGLSQWVGRDLFTMAAVYSTPGGGYTTFRREGAYYKVPAGKKLRVIGASFFCDNANDAMAILASGETAGTNITPVDVFYLSLFNALRYTNSGADTLKPASCVVNENCYLQLSYAVTSGSTSINSYVVCFLE